MDTDKPESSTRVYVADWWTDLEEQFGFEGNSGDEVWPSTRSPSVSGNCTFEMLLLSKMLNLHINDINCPSCFENAGDPPNVAVTLGVLFAHEHAAFRWV